MTSSRLNPKSSSSNKLEKNWRRNFNLTFGLHTLMYRQNHLHLSEHKYVCIYICMYVFIYVCLCVCMYVYVCLNSYPSIIYLSIYHWLISNIYQGVSTKRHMHILTSKQWLFPSCRQLFMTFAFLDNMSCSNSHNLYRFKSGSIIENVKKNSVNRM